MPIRFESGDHCTLCAKGISNSLSRSSTTWVVPVFTISGNLLSANLYSHCLSGDTQSEAKVLGLPLESIFKIAWPFHTKTLPDRSTVRLKTPSASAEERVLLAPSGLNLRMVWLLLSAAVTSPA